MRIIIGNVGHGFCAIIEGHDGTRVMIDCPRDWDLSWTPKKSIGAPYLDLLLISHNDEDHVSGLPLVLSLLSPWAIFTNPTLDSHALNLLKFPQNMGPGVKSTLRLLDQFGPGVMFGCVPINSYISGWVYFNRFGLYGFDTNNLSLVTFIRLGKFTALFPGDLERDGWLSLMQLPSFRADLASVNVLVASHHGRENGQCEEVFEYCKPEVTIFSDCEKSFSSQETVDWYAYRTIGKSNVRSFSNPDYTMRRKVLTTRNDGTILIDVDLFGNFGVDTHAESLRQLLSICPGIIESPILTGGQFSHCGLFDEVRM